MELSRRIRHRIDAQQKQQPKELFIFSPNADRKISELDVLARRKVQHNLFSFHTASVNMRQIAAVWLQNHITNDVPWIQFPFWVRSVVYGY